MTGAPFPRAWDPAQYSLLDAGEGRRLERFGGRVLDRPAPASRGPRRDPRWAEADARFERSGANVGRWLPAALQPWPVCHGPLVLEARSMPSGGIGVFPEQVDNWAWLADVVRQQAASTGRPPDVLNLFAHTGGATLAAAAAGARVAHVDASRPAVAWARHNGALSALADAPIRWLIDDAVAFARRELRRARRYDAIVLDPPSHGHAPNRARWQLEDALPDLLATCASLLAPGAAVLLTAHTPGYDADRLAAVVRAAFGAAASDVEARDLELRAATGASLPAGAAARIRSIA